MASTVGYFQIVNPDNQEWLGGYTAKNAAELRNGILCKINSDGTLQACGAGDVPSGFAINTESLNGLTYRPTDIYSAAGAPVTLVKGSNVRFLADWSNFTTAALPTFGDNLYTGASGLIAINSGAAAAYIGKCIGTDDHRIPPNTTQDLVLCEAKFLI